MTRADEDHEPLRGSAGAAFDWGVGHYETTAAQLLPAADVVVRSAKLRSGDRVLDLGCGTGNAALLAAGPGVQVTGVDPAPRLLEVARSRAAQEHKQITFVLGEAASLPVEDASVDVVLSVFGVIFVSDPVAALGEIDRVLSADGRVVISAWIPQGPIFEMNAVAAGAVREAQGPAPVMKPFAWHDPDALRALLALYGFTLEVEQHSLQFNASSPEEYLEAESRNHPLAIAGLGLLERVGRADEVRSRLLQILVAGNEAPGSFRATSQYVVATARREESVGSEQG
jgi:ubiquinone/menaquinone biosynthesis C-methylase UbiE